MDTGIEELIALGAASVALCAILALLTRVRAERGSAIARLTLIGRAANDVIYEWHIASQRLALSSAATAQLGYDVTRARLTRGWWEERLHPEDAGPVRDALATLLRSSGREWEMEYRFRKADGTFTTVHDHGYVQWSLGPRRRPVRMVGTLVNVDSISLYDPVTNLAGRALFRDRVERRAVGGAIAGEPFGVLVADIDDFRGFSARVGAPRADEVLLELSRRLETHLGEGETVARVGHDQLAFLISAVTAEDAIARAAQIRDSARIPFEDGLRLDIVAGAAILPQGGSPDLMRQALAALADAKRRRRRVAVYEPGGEQRWADRLRLRNDLAGALERRELVLHYQPIADAATGRCVALEALVRWDHPERGLLAADELLQVASDVDLGPEIDRWVLREATRAVSQLRQVHPDLRLAANVAVGSLDEQFPVSVRAMLAAALLPSDALSIELPEDASAATGPAAAALQELRALGVGIAIDDFGTGYASLLPAPAIPASEIKIDRVFSGRVSTDEHAMRIVRSVVQLARDLGLRVVGEGAEDEATVGQLRAMGVDLVQGRGVASPMTLEAVTKWLSPATQMGTAPAAAVPARRPMMIGEDEAVAAAVDASNASGAPVASRGAAPRPFGPDPMGWILPEVGMDVPHIAWAREGAAPAEAMPLARLTAAEPSFDEMRATAFASSFVTSVPSVQGAAPSARQRDLRILALESAGQPWELSRAREDRGAERVDERLVLLREYASRQALETDPVLVRT